MKTDFCGQRSYSSVDNTRLYIVEKCALQRAEPNEKVLLSEGAGSRNPEMCKSR